MAEDNVLPAISKGSMTAHRYRNLPSRCSSAHDCNTIPDLSFSKVLNYVMFFDSIALASAAAALFVLRHRARKSGDPRRDL